MSSSAIVNIYLFEPILNSNQDSSQLLEYEAIAPYEKYYELAVKIYDLNRSTNNELIDFLNSITLPEAYAPFVQILKEQINDYKNQKMDPSTLLPDFQPNKLRKYDLDELGRLINIDESSSLVIDTSTQTDFNKSQYLFMCMMNIIAFRITPMSLIQHIAFIILYVSFIVEEDVQTTKDKDILVSKIIEYCIRSCKYMKLFSIYYERLSPNNKILALQSEYGDIYKRSDDESRFHFIKEKIKASDPKLASTLECICVEESKAQGFYVNNLMLYNNIIKNINPKDFI